MAVTKAQVAQLYVALFNRAPEGAGLNAWVSAGVFRDQAQTADAMLQSPAIAAYFNGRIDTNRGYVENIYKNILGKDYSQDPDGINAWVRHLELGHTRGETLVTLFQVARSPEAIAADPTAAAVFANKTAIAAYMAEKITDIESDGSGNFNYAPFQQIIETTNSTNLEEQKAKIDQLADAAKPGSKIFTTGVDTLKGTEGDDTFSAVYYSGDGDKTSTLSSLDTLDGLGGKDTLKVTVLKNGSNSQLDLSDLDNAMRGVTNIENLEIRSEVTIKAPTAPALSKLNKGLDNLSITSPGDIKLETDTKEKVTIDTNKIATLTADKAKEISVKGGENSTISAKEATKASINLGTNTKILTVGANGLDKVEDLSLANLKLAAALTAAKLVKINVKDVDFNGAQIATDEEKVDLTTNYTEKGAAKLQANNATQLTIHANGEKESTIEFVSASPHNKLEKVTFDGNAKDLKINLQQETALKDVNAASFTGNFAELKVKNIAGSQVLLGSGNDVVDIDNTTAEQTINGGAGTDLISISTTIAGAGADKVTLKNFEGIRINNTIANGIDMSKWEGFNNITLAQGANAGQSLTKVLNNSTITVEKNALTNDLVVGIKDADTGTADKLNLVFNPKDTHAGLNNTGGFVIDDIENIDIASNLDDDKTNTATNTVNLKATADAKGTLTNVVIKGDANTKLGLDATFKKVKTVDASTLKGKFTFDASGHLDEKSVIKSGAGDDEITFGSKSGVTVTGGAGDDTFVLGTVGDSAAFPASKTATIKDFSKGDKLKIGADLTIAPPATIDQNIARYDSTKSLDFANNLSRALDVAKAASNKLAYFTYTDPDSNATDTYLVRSDATDGLSDDDYVVKLTGIVDLANATLANNSGLQLTL
nr:surface array protein [uncultured Campylobacter sp.]